MPHQDLPAGHVHVLDAQAAALAAPQAGAVQQADHQAVGAAAPSTASRRRCTCSAARTTGRRLGRRAADGVEVAQFHSQDLGIQKDQGVESLVLGAGGDVTADSQVGQEGELSAPISGVTQAVEAEVADGPLHVTLFRVGGVVADAQGQARRSTRRGGWGKGMSAKGRSRTWW